MTDPDLTDPDLTDPDKPSDAEATPPPHGATLCLLGLLWLAATLWSAHASIAGSAADPTVMISSAAIALPGVVAATLLAGAATGLAAVVRFAADRTARRRWLLGTAAGGGCGLVPALVILAGYGTTMAVVIVALTTFAAGLLGGAATALRPTVLGAGIAATLGVFVTGVLVYLFQSPLKALFGAGATIRSQAEASWWLSLTGAALGGVVAGMVAFSYLRRREAAPYWPDFLVAGAGAGLLLLLAEAITLLGGAGLLDLVSGLSEIDQASIGFLDAARLNQALVVGFVGGIVAMIALGRTMPGPPDQQPSAAAEDSGDGEPAGGDPAGSSPTGRTPDSGGDPPAAEGTDPSGTSTGVSPAPRRAR